MQANPSLPDQESTRRSKVEGNKSASPLALHIGVSIKFYKSMGSFTILEAGRPAFAITRVIRAGSIVEIILTALVELLEDEAKHGPVDIFLQDERTYSYMTNGQLDRWASNGWKASNRKPLKQADLYQRIHRALEGRSVRFFLDNKSPAMREAKAKSLSALNEQIKREAGQIFSEQEIK